MNLQRRRVLVGTAALAGGALAGCALPDRRGLVPMDQVYDDRACPATQAAVLLVLLPGIYMALSELQEQGFVAALRRRGLAVDVTLADTNFGYVQDHSVLRRLHDEVMVPARARGYRRFWLAGISLGGFVALAYAMTYPGELEGVLTLAPYLGRPELVDAIAAAGGPAAWLRTAPPPRDAEDVDTRVWQWLAAAPADAPALWLGHGRDDRFVAAHRMLATLLPPARVDTAAGGHDWPAWRELWGRWLERAPLPARCAG